MTEANAALRTLADRIAAGGRDALVERLRKAYADAAAAHADIVSLDAERIEAMVQAAAERADGLQWRRALADAAVQELGVSLPEALAHPAVAQAQELVGAPSYEASLAELVARPVPPAQPAPTTPAPEAAAPDPAAAPEPELAAERLETVEADDQVIELLPEPALDEPAQASDVQPAPEPDPNPAPDAVPDADPAPDQVIEEDPPPAPSQPERVIDEPESHGATDELEAVEADDEVVELLPPPEPIDDQPEEPAAVAPSDYVGEPTQPHSLEDLPAEAEGSTEAVALMEGWSAPEQSYGAEYGSEHTDYPPPEDQELRVTAYHQGGVANLPAGRNGLDLRISESGLDILQPAGEIIGRLHWNEIDALEVNPVRGRLRRQARTASRMIVRTKHGDASFEIPGFTSDELRQRVDPLVSRFRGAS